MLPIRLTIALSMSIALIGGATWFRFGQTTYIPSDITSVDKPGALSSGNEFLEDFLATNTPIAPATTPTEPFSKTDLIGRQLFSDYIGLASRNQTTPGEINALAERYAASIMDFNAPAPIEQSQIVVVLDSEVNLATYGDRVASIRNKYKNLVATRYGGGGVLNVDSLAFSTFTNAVGKLYRASANELLTLRVPASLAQNHLDLINNYLGSAAAMESLGDISKDPAHALAALNVQAKNTEEETGLLLNIQTTLMANGIIFEHSI